MLQKKRNKKNLAELSTRFIDLGANSPDFFNISFMPEQFTSGKNLFKFNPVANRFSNNDPIQIEIIDFNGNQVYHEVLNYKENDGSLIVAIYVYENTPAGNCTITFIGTTIVDEWFKLLPDNERKSNNLKYTHTLYINPNKQNDSEIIFINEPNVSVSERRFSIVEEKFSITKTGTFSSIGSYFYRNNFPKFIATTTNFEKYFQNGTIRFRSLSDDYTPSIGFNTSSFEYTSDIVNVRTPFEMTLKTPVKVTGTLDQTQILKSISNQQYEVTFSYTPTRRLISENIKTYAQFDISNLEPAVGDVTRVKIFYKTTFKPESDYEQIYDAEIGNKNILVDVSSSMVEYPIGIFEGPEEFGTPIFPTSFQNLNAISYWTASTNDPYAIASISTDDIPLFGSLLPMADREISGSSEIIVKQSNIVSIPYYVDSEYKVVFDYYMDDDISEPRGGKIDVYVTGSSFVNDSQFGKYVGSVVSGSQAKRFELDYSLPIPTNRDGTGELVFVLRRGCAISNIRVMESVEYGFTPKRVRLYVPIKFDHRNEYLDFKIQFFNNTLLGANKDVEIYDKLFVGGNTYIYGSDNLITGSTFVSPFTASGIHIYGDKTIDSSGSAIKSYGYEGINEATASLNPTDHSKFGWGLITHDPFHNKQDTGKTVEMINECGALFAFKASPPSFKLYAVGENSSVVIGTSGSSVDGGTSGTSGTIGGGSVATDCHNGTCGESYITWDGCRIVIRGVYDYQGNAINGSMGSSGTSGTPGSSGTSGIDGSSGMSGPAGTSGIDGSSGTSGTPGSSGTSGGNGSSGTSGISGSSGTSGVTGSSGTSGQTPSPLDCCDCADLTLQIVQWQLAGGAPVQPTGRYPLVEQCGLISWTP